MRNPLRALGALTLMVAALPAMAAEGPLQADAYVTAASPNSNFGTAPTLSVGAGATALAKFSLASLWSVRAASPPPARVEVLTMLGRWSEPSVRRECSGGAAQGAARWVGGRQGPRGRGADARLQR